MNIVVEIVILLVKLFYYWLEWVYRLFVSPSPKSIQGQVVLVTGGARGIGRCIVERLAKHGARVAIWDINEALCKETAESIRETGATCYGYRCDITKPDDIARVAKLVRNDLGDVEILINNAGIASGSVLMDYSETDIRRTFEVNVFAHYWTIREFLPWMIENKRGHIVNLTSMMSHISSANCWPYSSSKFAANGFSECLQDELRYINVHNDIQLTTVYPFAVVTPMLTELRDKFVYYGRFDKPITPEEVGDTAVDGILRNRRYVYVPRLGALVVLMYLLPSKSKLALLQFTQSGFYEAHKVQRTY